MESAILLYGQKWLWKVIAPEGFEFDGVQREPDERFPRAEEYWHSITLD